MKKSNLITIILLIYLGVYGLYRLAQIYRSRQYVEYFAIILVTLIGNIFLL